MNEVLTTIQRQKGFDYKVDKKGQVIKSKYNYFKDPYTYITLIIILMAYLYSNEVKVARQFVDSPCVEKCMIDDYIEEFNLQHPGIQLVCDYKTKSCMYNGVLDNSTVNVLDLRGFNLTKA